MKAILMIMTAVCGFVCLGNEWTDERGFVWSYKIGSAGAIVTSGKSSVPAVSPTPTGYIVIPEQLGGQPVVEIGSYAFYNCSSLYSIAVPDTVTSFGYCSFASCSMLTDINMPRNLVQIKDAVFSGCKKLKAIKLPPTVESIGGAFKNCSGLTEFIVPEKVVVLNANLFYGCNNITNVVVKGPIVDIRAQAFQDCSALKSIDIPDSVTNIGSQAFVSCSNLEKVKLPANLECLGPLAFQNCKKVRNVTLPSKLKVIGNSAFHNCLCVDSITIPQSVISIGNDALGACSSLTNVVISEGVENVGDYVFQYCSALKNITFPSTLKSIGYFQFQYCKNLKRVVYLGNPPMADLYLYTDTPVDLISYVTRGKQGWWISPDGDLPESWMDRPIRYLEEVPLNWPANYPMFKAKFGEDFAKALMKKTGKKDSAGHDMYVWQDYVAGTDPTDEDDMLKASIKIVDGVPVISCIPEHSAEQKAFRTYKTYGKLRLDDKVWTDLSNMTGSEKSDYKFFKISVGMK